MTIPFNQTSRKTPFSSFGAGGGRKSVPIYKKVAKFKPSPYSNRIFVEGIIGYFALKVFKKKRKFFFF